MGTMSFLLPSGWPAEAVRELERACVVDGREGMPWPSETRLQPDRFMLRRAVEDSGALVTPWDVGPAGRLMCATATLMERPLPYHLQIELARGKVNQLRCQCADWRAGGLQVSDALLQEVRDISLLFGRAVTQAPSEDAGRLAQQALERAARAAEQLVNAYLDQVFQIRHVRSPRLDTILGCRLDQAVPQGETAAALTRTFNGVSLPFAWHAVEAKRDTFSWETIDAQLTWAEAQGLSISAGPLVDFSSSQLPGWLWQHERDLSALSRFMCRYVEMAVRRYRTRVPRWQLTAASNSASVLSLGEEELLLLTVRIAEAARQVDPSLDLIIGIAQPWGEYMAVEDRNHSPFIFAETLIRAGLPVAALDVELVMGVTPRGSYCRDLLDTSRLIDMYALLGVPLRMTLGYPSATSPDLQADPDLRVAAGHWHGPISPATQADWAAAFARLAVGKPYVQGVHWVDLSDATPHHFCHAGLFDTQGRPKPALDRLRAVREQHLR